MTPIIRPARCLCPSCVTILQGLIFPLKQLRGPGLGSVTGAAADPGASTVLGGVSWDML